MRVTSAGYKIQFSPRRRCNHAADCESSSLSPGHVTDAGGSVSAVSVSGVDGGEGADERRDGGRKDKDDEDSVWNNGRNGM